MSSKRKTQHGAPPDYWTEFVEMGEQCKYCEPNAALLYSADYQCYGVQNADGTNSWLPAPIEHRHWINNRYRVEAHYETNGEVAYCRIWRADKKPLRSWMDMQRIKNEIAGEEVEGCEVFPKASELVNIDNTYWLWITPHNI